MPSLISGEDGLSLFVGRGGLEPPTFRARDGARTLYQLSYRPVFMIRDGTINVAREAGIEPATPQIYTPGPLPTEVLALVRTRYRRNKARDAKRAEGSVENLRKGGLTVIARYACEENAHSRASCQPPCSLSSTSSCSASVNFHQSMSSRSESSAVRSSTGFLTSFKYSSKKLTSSPVPVLQPLSLPRVSAARGRGAG